MISCLFWLLLGLDHRVTVRLLDPVSSVHSKVGDRVRAVMVSPPTGALVEGTVTEVAKIEGKQRRAKLRIEFARPHRADLVGVDNARETVTDDGSILGMPLFKIRPSKVESLLLVAAYAHPVALALYEGAELARREADKPEINFVAGTEFILRWPGAIPSGTVAPPAALTDHSEVADLLRQFPQRASARNGTSSDFTNLVFVGQQEQLEDAFQAAGWFAARGLTLKNATAAFFAIAQRHAYKRAPVSALYLDGRLPDLVFEKQNDTLAKRHHLRIWRQPQTFHGQPVWLAAATHDVGIQFSGEAKAFCHRIDPLIDDERQKVVDDLTFAGHVRAVGAVSRPGAPSSGKNATGGTIETDGSVAVLMLR